MTIVQEHLEGDLAVREIITIGPHAAILYILSPEGARSIDRGVPVSVGETYGTRGLVGVRIVSAPFQQNVVAGSGRRHC